MDATVHAYACVQLHAETVTIKSGVTTPYFTMTHQSTVNRNNHEINDGYNCTGFIGL